MAKGKSNPKTVERVKGMTKAMRNEMERAEAEAAATEATARSAKEKRRGRRRGDASSDEDEGEGMHTENATSSATQHKHAKAAHLCRKATIGPVQKLGASLPSVQCPVENPEPICALLPPFLNPLPTQFQLFE